MANTTKKHGRVYTPDYIVNLILDFGGYNDNGLLRHHVIDNSCGDGAFLVEIVNRYCTFFLAESDNLQVLSTELETFIHGIEIDKDEYAKCIDNLNKIAEKHGLKNLNWDIVNGDTLTIDQYNGKMDFVFGNPPYVRVHNLEENYDAVKKYHFAEQGMTDLYIVFFEIGFNMLASNGTMCLITPSSWLSSLAGKHLRNYIATYQNMSAVIDLEHFQPFEATTYTLISKFEKTKKSDSIDYFIFDSGNLNKRYIETLNYKDVFIGGNLYFAPKSDLDLLKSIKTETICQYVSVKNGFATLADKVFIGDFDFTEGTIDILKASTGKWSKCIFPYSYDGKPLSPNEFREKHEVFNYLLLHKEQLAKGRDFAGDDYWYLFGRTQALKDVCKTKYAINTIIRDVGSIRIEEVGKGKGVYSGLYIMTDIDFETIKELVCSTEFVNYIKLLKNYKSGGYYTFASKDLERYLNYKLTKKYGQSRISSGSARLF